MSARSPSCRTTPAGSTSMAGAEASCTSPCTSTPSATSRSARYEPSCPVIPVTNAVVTPSPPGEVGLLLEVVLDHHGDEPREVDLALPAELLLRLGGVADQEVHLGRPHEARVLLDIARPVVDADV